MEDLENQSVEAEMRFFKIRLIVAKVIAQKELLNDTKSNKIDRILVHPILGYLIFTLVLFILFQFIYVFAALPMDLIDGSFSTLSSWSNLSK